MHINVIRDALTERPFRPFILQTVGGRDYPVRHPEMMLVLPGQRTVFVVTSPHSGVLLDTITIEGLHHMGRNGGNAKKPRRRR